MYLVGQDFGTNVKMNFIGRYKFLFYGKDKGGEIIFIYIADIGYLFFFNKTRAIIRSKSLKRSSVTL